MEKKIAIFKAEIMLEIAEELLKGAAGPCDYWFKKLAERLTERAKKIMEETL